MEITAEDIKRLCYEVSRFSKAGGLRWKGLPVVTWEFADISDFVNTRMMVLRALDPELKYSGEHGRQTDDDTEEIDVYGVTFRLICKQKMMTRREPFSAPEVR